MTILFHDQPSNPSRRCRFFSSLMKDVFFNCHTCNRTLSFSSRGEDEAHTSYFIDEQEVVSIIKARAMEAKFKRKNIRWDESSSSVFYPVTLSELFVRSKKIEENKEGESEDEIKQEEMHKHNEEKEEYLSAASHFSCCSCAASEFFSANTNFSHCLSFKDLERFTELERRSIFHEFSHCKGWPFGLCRRAMLLPPLPKSPSDSWSWCKHTKFVKNC